MSVTIPQKVYKETLEKFKAQYENEFGEISNDMKSFSRNQLIEKYLQDLEFWKTRVPNIDTNQAPDISIICEHAIASNAVNEIKKRATMYGIQDDM